MLVAFSFGNCRFGDPSDTIFTVPGLFRKPAKPSLSCFCTAIALSIGLTIQFGVGIMRDIRAGGHPPNFLTLAAYWLIWNVLPLAIFGVGMLLRKQRR
jgi:hypothetical protein